eukprot:a846169_66.p2 GENE.a846169_66~~a846169_66.p2  ORF type:complete len:538 (-),score=209.28 a846169_66:110-1693(-)
MRLSVLVLCALVAAACADVTVLWPQPASVSSGTGSVTLDAAAFSLRSECQSSKILAAALSRFEGFVFPYGRGGKRGAPRVMDSSTVAFLGVCVASPSEALGLDTDVSYSLYLSATTAVLNATTVFGALHGLETFSQLVDYDWQSDAYSMSYLPVAIDDAPRFPWRGLLVDTARHYYDVESLLHIVDTLAQNKMNVMHWHIVDAQSFPLVSSAYPNLSTAGAYHPTAVYTPADLELVVSYAYERGVNVLFELDGPGHSYAMALGYPELGVDCPTYEANINNIPQNPIVSNGISALAVVESLYNLTAAASPFPFIHTGGDEVVQACWSDNAAVVEWMKDNGLNTQGLYQYFEDAYQGFVAALNRTALIWEDPFDNGLKIPTETIIEVWRNQATLQEVVAAGYRAILAAPYYLDQQIPNATVTHYEWEDTWQNFWGSDPVSGLSAAEAELVIGGEACMWSEQVMPTNFDSRVWPRASGFAERFWSPASVNNLANAIGRLNAHSCRMQIRGVYCGPIEPSFCLLPTSPFAK